MADKHTPIIKITGDAGEVSKLLSYFSGKKVRITKKKRRDGNYNCYVKCYYLTDN